MDLRPVGLENNYKMTETDVTKLIKLRATNDAIFTGKRNSVMPAWRALLKEMGLQGRLTALQLKKKWENMKMKYKDFKNPPLGMDNKLSPNSWHWFHLMDQAMTGQLAGSARLLNPSLFDMEEDDTSSPVPIKRVCLRPDGVEEVSNFEFWAKAQLGVGVEMPSAAAGDGGPPYTDAATEEIRRATVECERALQGQRDTGNGVTEYAITVAVDEGMEERSERKHLVNHDTGHAIAGAGRNIEREMAELERQIAELEKEREVLEREQAEFDRERLMMEREREVVNRERVFLERSRATLENDRASIDRERAVLDRDRAVLDRDRALIERERAELAREREAFTQNKMAAHDAELEPDRLERREKLLSLFEKLIEKL